MISVSLINSWQVNQNIIVNEELNFLPKKFYFNSENEHEYISDMQLADLITYLPDDIFANLIEHQCFQV